MFSFTQRAMTAAWRVWTKLEAILNWPGRFNTPSFHHLIQNNKSTRRPATAWPRHKLSPGPQIQYVSTMYKPASLPWLTFISEYLLQTHKIWRSQQNTLEPLTNLAGHSQNGLNFTVACWGYLEPRSEAVIHISRLLFIMRGENLVQSQFLDKKDAVVQHH